MFKYKRRIQYILDIDARYSPPWLIDVEAMANPLLVERDMPPVGKWALNFARRQPKLKIRIFWASGSNWWGNRDDCYQSNCVRMSSDTY
ncbi:hypothetical protein HZ326_25996 [Fusarium oxysporum f. sp. albedinis]|nr:hypothetical protein HZ326_25996 [Fusarium oxysporum f. sp. albedinis]